MNDRLIFIGASGTGKSTAALGFMTKPSETAIIQHKGSAGFRYIATIPALKDMWVRDAANFADFASQSMNIMAHLQITLKLDLHKLI